MTACSAALSPRSVTVLQKHSRSRLGTGRAPATVGESPLEDPGTLARNGWPVGAGVLERSARRQHDDEG